jgi:HAD superfamily hydrolase (TIGR01509 family)
MATLIIYDCDGTLIDTESVYGDVTLEQIESLGLTGWTRERYVEAMVGIPYPQCWDSVIADYGRPLPDGFFAAIDQKVEERFSRGIPVLPGVEMAVAEIGLPRCVASSTGLPALRRNLATAGLLPIFDPHVFSASQVARGKPAPDVFLHAAAQMGHDPADCLVIEDSVPGVQAARRAGMRVIGFTGAAHDADWLTPRLLEAGALTVVPVFGMLPALIANLRG